MNMKENDCSLTKILPTAISRHCIFRVDPMSLFILVVIFKLANSASQPVNASNGPDPNRSITNISIVHNHRGASVTNIYLI